ncbi:MAG: hypothetical protein DHS20C18_33530 [Saprospiraceae bacterium]|nr:MAG: hypothetical protein DHS20C18_33530 [Saprospiraceae bacterium]
MKRRNFIIIAAAGTVAIAGPPLYYYWSDIRYENALIQPKSLARIWDAETIQSIGKTYCRQFPKEKNKEVLLKRLLAGMNNSDDLATALEQQIKEDFETGNTVMVNGWILSITEARQCALFAASAHK